MLIIKKEKEINRVCIGTLMPRDCFHIDSDRVFMYVEKRVNCSGKDNVFIIDLVTGVTKEIPDTTLVEELDATLIVNSL